MIADEQLFQRVQQENQRQILDKLLHDLRNPVHALRITLELFSRLANKKGDVGVLLDRAGRYVVPAEAAMNTLIANTERLSTYMYPPAAPLISPVGVDELLTEVAILLRGAARQLKVEVAPVTESAVQLAADRPRLGHALLRHCLSNAGTRVSLSVRANAEHVWIDVESDPAAGATTDLCAFPAEELRVLIENAGGTMATGIGGRLSAGFPRPHPS